MKTVVRAISGAIKGLEKLMNDHSSCKMGERVGLDSLESLKKGVVHLLVMTNALRVEIGGNATGTESEDTYVGAIQLVTEGIGEGLLAGLVGVVDSFARERGNLQTGDGGHVQNSAGLLLEHSPVEDGVGHKHVSVDVGVVHGHNLRRGKVVECIGSAERETGLTWKLAKPAMVKFGRGSSHIVNKNVNVAQLVNSSADGLFYTLEVTNVDGSIADLGVGTWTGRQLLLQLLEFVLFRRVSEVASSVTTREKRTSERDNRTMLAPASTIEEAIDSPIPMEAPV